MALHKEFKSEMTNFDAMSAYVQARNLDPRQEKPDVNLSIHPAPIR